MKSASHRLIAATLFLALPAIAAAEPKETGERGHVEIGTTLTVMADSSRAEAGESVMAFDVLTNIPTARGNWGMLVEAVTDPMAAPVPDRTRLTAGTGTWGQVQDGQARLTEVHYSFQSLGGDWSLGLLDSKTHIDGSNVANDDKEQFLGAAFVNNPAIAIPGSGFGIAYRHAPGALAPGFTVLMSASEVAVAGSNESEDSLFLAFETAREIGGLAARLGTWANGIRRPGVSQLESGHRDYGFYASMDGQNARLGWNVRGGIARLGDRAQESFLGAATLIPLRQSVLGIGIGHSVRNGRALTGDGGRTSYLEVFYRFTALGRLIVTPDLQYQRISGAPNAGSGLSACVRIRMVI